ncbi:MAG: tRNA (adenosine(37)-N6)-threonylcarbamoyltransferase complex transferase subunit TsaD [bacterium]
MKILGIETSCDETALAVVEGTRVVCEQVYSQTEHERFGGIVPEIASRQQIRKIGPLFTACEQDFEVGPNSIDGIAVTCGPGLIGSLLVGLNFGKALAYGWGLPLIGINHLEGHIFANRLSEPPVEPPFICLIVSGGHTMLVKVSDWGEYQVLGSTRDDAAGEAYDKVAKLLGLGYPGGRPIDELAATGDPNFHRFPIARFKSGDFQFSFSGIKTAVAVLLKERGEDVVRQHLADLCASFQACVIEMLVTPTLAAAEEYGIKRIAIGGGVAANSGLRNAMQRRGQESGLEVFFPPLKYCTDNAAMIAAAGCFRLERGERSELSLTATPYLPLS